MSAAAAVLGRPRGSPRGDRIERKGSRARLLCATSGQVLPWTLVMLLVLLPLAMGALGAGAAYLVRDQLQTAADAAALAAAGRAALWESLAVSWHDFACATSRTPLAAGPPVCRDGPEQTSNLPRTFAARLFATSAAGLPGWAAAAGCETVGADPAPPLSMPVSVCDAWRLQPGGFGVAYGLAFPSSADPRSAARAYLRSNTTNLRTHGVAVTLIALEADATTGQVDLTVRATEPGNPLGLVAGRPTTVTVQAGAQRRVVPPPASGS